jgi:hypothetical protein
MYNLSVAVAQTYYVGEGQWLVHNCPTQQVIRQTNGTSFVSWFDTQLDSSLWVNKRGVHFEAANEALYNAMKADPKLEAYFQVNHPDVWRDVQPRPGGGFSSESPGNFTWHHSTSDQAGGRMGVMQLVPHQHHRDNFKLYHPTGSGGCKEWGGRCR